MSNGGLGTLPVPRQAPRPPATPRRVRPAAARPVPAAPVHDSLARRRWGFAAALVLMLVTLPVHLLGLALVGLEVLSPSTDGTGPLFVAGVGVAQVLLLAGVASVGQLIGGGGHVWRRRVALSCLNALLVVAAAGIAWAFLL